MEEVLNKEIAQQLMRTEGETRGVNLKNDAGFVLAREGKEGVKKLEEELERLGCPIKYEKIRSLNFYPIGLRTISLLTTKKVFSMGDEDIRDMCGFSMATSIIIRLYMKFFHSIPKVLEQAPKMLGEYYTVGNIFVKEYNEKEKRVILIIEQLDLHQVFCRCLEGYLRNIAKAVTGSKNVTCQEINCVFRGAKNHEFIIQWQ